MLALVGRGLTNAEIAEELFISVKTASVHVSNILRKLGLKSRIQAAAVAQRRTHQTASPTPNHKRKSTLVRPGGPRDVQRSDPRVSTRFRGLAKGEWSAQRCSVGAHRYAGVRGPEAAPGQEAMLRVH